MQQQASSVIANALAQPKDAVFFSLSHSLAALYPERFVLENEEGSFDVPRFANAGLCTSSLHGEQHSELEYNYVAENESYWPEPYNCWQQVEWEGHSIEVVTIGLEGSHCRTVRHYVIAENEAVATRFLITVCSWNSEVRGEVLVFNGHWYKDADLYESIKGATLENLILEGDLKEGIVSDFESFFASQETYDRYKIPWKRGVLFLGPPGNGKTHMIKGLVNRLDLPCLYVKSFKHPYSTDHEMMQQVFRRARTSAPCVLVLEDLDSLLDDENRSFFLNEMDGFASNRGIMFVATTNHPERLDPAILERPSRFDRKYQFNLPEEDCRLAYLTLCNAGLEDQLRVSDEQLKQLAAETGDFSFAYLKELVLSAMMAWISKPGASPMHEVMLSQIETLRSQMHTEAPEAPEQPMSPYQAQMQYMKRWRPGRK